MQRLRPPDLLAGVAGAVLIASLALEGINFWLALTGALALGLTVVTAVRDTPALPVALDVLSTWAALIAVPVAIIRGDVLGMVAVAGVFAGSWWAMRRQDQPGLKPPPEPQAMPAPPA